jgi:hypothetical protein
MGVAGQGIALAWRRNALSQATASRANIYSRLDSRTSSLSSSLVSVIAEMSSSAQAAAPTPVERIGSSIRRPLVQIL